MDPRVVPAVLLTVTVELVMGLLLIPPMRTEPGGPLVLAKLTVVIVSCADATAGTAAINAMTATTLQTSRPARRE